MSEDVELVRRVFRDAATCRIATVRSDGGPHVALDGRSTLDLLGDGFVLLTGPEGEGWSAAGVPTHVVSEPEFPGAYGISPSGAALVEYALLLALIAVV